MPEDAVSGRTLIRYLVPCTVQGGKWRIVYLCGLWRLGRYRVKYGYKIAGKVYPEVCPIKELIQMVKKLKLVFVE